MMTATRAHAIGSPRYQMVWAAVPIAIVVMFAGFAIGLSRLAVAGGGFAGYGASLLLARIFPARQLFPYLR